MPDSIPPSAWKAQSWKNGRGTTHEIIRWPDTDAYDVRVSVADLVETATFSQFPGYRRWSVLIEPSLMVLATRRGVEGETGSIYRFSAVGDFVELDGEMVIDASLLDGPTRLLNILARKDVPVTVGISVPQRPVRFAFALEEGGALPRGHARMFDPPERIDTRVVWIA